MTFNSIFVIVLVTKIIELMCGALLGLIVAILDYNLDKFKENSFLKKVYWQMTNHETYFLYGSMIIANVISVFVLSFIFWNYFTFLLLFFRPKYILYNEGGKKGMKIMLYILGFLVSLLMAFVVLFGLLVTFETSGISVSKMTQNQKAGLTFFIICVAIITALMFGRYVL